MPMHDRAVRTPPANQALEDMRQHIGNSDAAEQAVGLAPQASVLCAEPCMQPEQCRRAKHDLLVGKPGDALQHALGARTRCARESPAGRQVGTRRRQSDRRTERHSNHSSADGTTRRDNGAELLGFREDTLLNQVDRARPGLVAVGLGDADVDRQVAAPPCACHAMLAGDPAAPIGLGKAIDAQLAIEAAAIEGIAASASAARSTRPKRHWSRGPARRVAHRRARGRCRQGCRWSPRSRRASVPGLVSRTCRSGLRKFTGAKRAMRLPASVSRPCQCVSRPRPRYSAPCQSTRTRRPRSAAA